MLGAMQEILSVQDLKWNNVKTVDFELFSSQSKFTDDTVMTIAIADAILNKEYHKNDAIESTKIYACKPERIRQEIS